MAESSEVAKIKEYKGLLDEGIISQEEFEEKKQAIMAHGDQKGNSVSSIINEVPTATGKLSTKSKIAAGLFGLFFGAFGVHNFYLGYKNKAILQLVLTIVGFLTLIIAIGAVILIGVEIWTFIESIMILTSRKGSQWHLDAMENELLD